MKRLLSIEIYKVKHHKLSKILFVSYFLLLSSIALVAAIQFDFAGLNIHLAEQGIFNFPYIWHFNTWLADFFTFFLAIIVVSMVTNEYGYRTVKQNLIDGLSKKEFVLSKFYFLVVLSLLATVFVFIISLVLGLIYSDYTSVSIIFSDLYFFLAFFLKILGVFSLVMFLGFLLKKSAYALGFFFVWVLVEQIFYGLIRWQFATKDLAETVSSFFPYTSIHKLIPEPITRLNAAKKIGKQIGEDLADFDGIPLQCYLIAIVWIAMFIYFSYKILKKRDL
jgi:ABC-type transport system involved in multi-copper enzyme maturation permease subunit